MPTLQEVSAQMPELKATKRVNPKIGAMADFLKYLKSAESTQQMQGLMSVLPFVDDLETVLDRVSYGEPLTTGKGMTTALRPEAKSMVELATIFAPGGRVAGPAAESGAMALGRAGEQYAERKVPQIMAQGGRPAQLLSDLARGTVSPATVYHGSPHKFTKFDASKIGTGEGAQAYGYGIYTAENPAVAKGYADKLATTGRSGPWWEDMVRQRIAKGESIDDAKKFVAQNNPSLAKKIIAIPDKSLAVNKSLYKVDLPDEMIPKMLDYDKHLSEQSPGVQKILSAYQKEIGGSFGTGDQTLKAIAFERRMKGLDDSPAAVAQQLREMGIPGVKYLDEGSRAKGEGTRNFVTFPGEEHMLKIETINGDPLDLLLQGVK